VTPSLEPALQIEPGRIGGIGAREAALYETEALAFSPYCFLKAFVVSHEPRLHRSA